MQLVSLKLQIGALVFQLRMLPVFLNDGVLEIFNDCFEYFGVSSLQRSSSCENGCFEIDNIYRQLNR